MSELTLTDPTMRLLAALTDETDPVLVQVVDHARRGDGLAPSRMALETGPLSVVGDALALFCLGYADREDYRTALAACQKLAKEGTAAERELAATSIAVLEASSIVYRGMYVVSRNSREADARMACASTALRGSWARLVASAMRASNARKTA